MINLADLTVIFLTKNRNNYLVRNLKRWSQTDAKIIVMDGSSESNSDLILSLLPNVKYFHNNNSLEQRLYFASQIINTKYAMMASDDDLLIFEGVDSCIRELENNPDLVSVVGKPLGFRLEQNVVKFFPVYPNFSKFGVASSSNHWVRSYIHFKNYECTTIYSVLRSEIFKNICSVFKHTPTLSGNLMELIFEFSATFLGKNKVITQLYLLKSQECHANWRSTDPYGHWVLSINNRVRRDLVSILDKNILSSKSHVFGGIRRKIFLLTLLSQQLSDLSQRFRISKKFRWMIFLPLFFFVNFSLSWRSKVVLLKNKIVLWQKNLFQNAALEEFSERKNLEKLTNNNDFASEELIRNHPGLKEIKKLIENFHIGQRI